MATAEDCFLIFDRRTISIGADKAEETGAVSRMYDDDDDSIIIIGYTCNDLRIESGEKSEWRVHANMFIKTEY